MEIRKINVSFESILVMILLILFAVSACILIIEGSTSYQGIVEEKEQQENVRIALSYINMKIRQNDVSGHIRIQENSVGSRDALVIKHSDEEEGLVTYIYYEDGYLWECYTDVNETPIHHMSSQIVPINGLDLAYDPLYALLTITIHHEYADEIGSINSYIGIRTD